MTAAQLWEEAQKLQDTLVSHRRYLHTHPGTGFDLGTTAAYVKQELEQMGYEPQECGKAGMIALAGQKAGKTAAPAGQKDSGKVFLLRADMDALPIQEQAEVPFAAANGCMHACGHDLHTAMLLGAAKLLKEHENEIAGTVKLMFQPAEEIFEGAQDMIDAGLLEDPSVDAALMIHVMAGVPLTPGAVIVSAPGVSAPAADYFEIQVQGRGCHGSMPNMGADPLNAAAHILIALEEIHARELAMDDRVVLTIGTMHAGTAANAIPDTAVMRGSIRTFDEETRTFVKERLIQVAEGTAKVFRTQASVTFGSGCPTLFNHQELADCAVKYVKELLGENKAFSAAQLQAMGGGKQSSKTAGSEDFAYVSQKVPSVMLALAAGQPEKGYQYPQHHPKVMFDESVLAGGSAVYAYTAMRWLEDSGSDAQISVIREHSEKLQKIL